MYNRRNPSSRVEVIDLDPYGTVAPFVDAAVQSISDGGVLRPLPPARSYSLFQRTVVYHLY